MYNIKVCNVAPVGCVQRRREHQGSAGRSLTESQVHQMSPAVSITLLRLSERSLLIARHQVKKKKRKALIFTVVEVE